jgi:hypothetical protein
MKETSDIDLDFLQRRAKACGHYVNRHKFYDPTRGGGDLYLSKAKRVRTDPPERWIVTFSTVADIEAKLAEIEHAQEEARQQSRCDPRCISLRPERNASSGGI